MPASQVGELAHLQPFDEMGGPRAGLARRHVVQLTEIDEQLATGEPQVEPGIGGKKPENTLDLRGLRGDVEPGQPRGAGAGRHQAAQHS